MSISVTFNGSTYSLPEAREIGWAALTNYLVDLANAQVAGGPQSANLRIATSSPVTVASTDYVVATDLTIAGAVTVNLPAGTNEKLVLIVDGKGDSTTNNVTINANGAETINGSASFVLAENRTAVLMQYSTTGTKWIVLGIYKQNVITRLSSDTGANRVKNKELEDSTVKFVDATDTTKKIYFTAAPATSGASLQLVSNASTNKQLTFPDATAILLADSATQTISNKDYDGGTASNTSRITLPKAATATLNGLTRKQGTVVYDTTTNAVKFDDGSTLTALASAATVADSSQDYKNGSVAASVAANALTIALKDKSGSDPSGGSPVTAAFRNATSATGTYAVVNVTGALSVVVSSGSTLGNASGVAEFIYVYLINNAGTAELAVSTAPYDEGSVVTTIAEGGAGAADSRSAIYSTTARSNVALRLIARLKSTQATAGTWATAISEISNIPFENVGQILGTQTNTAFITGYVGEYLEQTRTSSTAIANDSFFDVTASPLSLTAGDWDIYGQAEFLQGATSGAGTIFTLGIGTASGTSTTGLVNGTNTVRYTSGVSAVNLVGLVVASVRVSISATTSYYLKGCAQHVAVADNTNNAGRISARRIR